MKNSIFISILFIIVFISASCAPVSFYSNPELTEKAGLKYYTKKPYLMVERDPESNRISNAIVIYLPDLANPQYMIINGGIGSRKIEMELSEGSIKSFGSTSDPEIDETVTALAGLISKGAGTLTDIAALRNPPTLIENEVSVELYEILIDSGGTRVRKVEINQ